MKRFIVRAETEESIWLRLWKASEDLRFSPRWRSRKAFSMGAHPHCRSVIGAQNDVNLPAIDPERKSE
jgi:hypothetical protein